MHHGCVACIGSWREDSNPQPACEMSPPVACGHLARPAHPVTHAAVAVASDLYRQQPLAATRLQPDENRPWAAAGICSP
jgi:hypothetical protein